MYERISGWTDSDAGCWRCWDCNRNEGRREEAHPCLSLLSCSLRVLPAEWKSSDCSVAAESKYRGLAAVKPCTFWEEHMKTETSNIRSKAIFSDDGEHRLLLWKEWNKDKPAAMIIMINPNTADTLNMDLTTMLTINNLNALGYGSVNIVNLYSRIMGKLSLRFNSDEDLLDESNDAVIVKYAEKSDVIIIAWGSIGNHSQRIRDRQADLLEQLADHADKLYQIGEKRYHPLTPIVRTDWKLRKYEMEGSYAEDENDG